MLDTIGQVAARTGGLASSYAETAGAQANQYYMQQLADKIPELRQLAYEMYRTEGGDMRDNLGMLMSLENSDYSKFLNDRNQFNTDRAFTYGMSRDRIADERYETEWGYNTSQNERKEAQARVDAFLAAGGKAADIPDDLLTASGYTEQELAAMERYYVEQKWLKSAGGGGGKKSDDYSAVLSEAKSILKSKGAKAASEYLGKMVDGGYISETEKMNIESSS